jgi:hypothetical protein
MTWEGQRIGRLMRYLTPRVVSPPRPLLAVAAIRRVPTYNYREPVAPATTSSSTTSPLPPFLTPQVRIPGVARRPGLQIRAQRCRQASCGGPREDGGGTEADVGRPAQAGLLRGGPLSLQPPGRLSSRNPVEVRLQRVTPAGSICEVKRLVTAMELARGSKDRMKRTDNFPLPHRGDGVARLDSIYVFYPLMRASPRLVPRRCKC